MSRRLLLLTVPCIAAIAMFGLLAPANVHTVAPRDVHNEVRDVPLDDVGGDDDDPAARGEWERARMCDPATGLVPRGIRAAELAYAGSLPDHESFFGKGAGVLDYGWTLRGPFNVGGRTRALALDVRGEDTMFAGGASGGMWRSTNAGASWTRVTPHAAISSVTCIAQDVRPGKGNVWYYGTGEIVGGSASAGGAYFSGDGIFKSTDGGLTWKSLLASHTPQTFDSYNDYVWRIATDPSDSAHDRVYMATYGAITISTDGGTTWRNKLVGSTANSVYTDIAVAGSGVAYATMSSDGQKRGIWRTGDYGETWVSITPAAFPAKYNRIVIGVSQSNPNVAYFLGETPGTGHLGHDFKGTANYTSLWKYTFVSGNGTGTGGTWEDRSANLPSFGGSFGDFNPQSSYDLHCVVYPADENSVFVGGTNLYRSTDGFASSTSTAWIGGYRDVPIDSTVRLQLEYPNHHPDQHWLLFSRTNPNVAYTASDGGVHRTGNILAGDVAWTSLNNGYLTTQFYSVAIDHATQGDQSLVGGLQDNGTWGTKSVSATTPWNWLGSGDGSICAIADSGTSYYVSKQEGKVYRVLVNGDGTLSTYTRVDPAGESNNLFVNPFVLDPSDNRIMYFPAGNQLFRNSDLTQIPLLSTDRATTNWFAYTQTAISPTGHITAVGASQSLPSHRLYFGTDSGRVYRIDGADTGDPLPVNITAAGFPKGPAYVNCIAVDPMDGNRAVVVFSNYLVQSLFLTTDGGGSWNAIGGNLEANASGTGPGPSCRWFTFLHRVGGTVYLVGTSTGLYSTTVLNGTSTVWSLEGAETIGNTVVDMIDARQSDGFVAVATHGSGMFTTTIAPLAVDGPASSRNGLTLMAPVPNPVSTAARIDFTLAPMPGAALQQVRLVLFDLAGHAVGELVDEAMPAGAHSAFFDLADYRYAMLPAGTYYCRLEAGGRSLTRSMTILR
ncbi:MAG: flagellar basal body rod modification protein [Bacteroidetes bacterium]|nr:flagellar basal body rod modification protein [Bacteroidota bacterium]